VEKLQDVWESLVKPKYPTLNEQQLIELRSQAAIDWLTDEETELSNLFDQYVMLKQLLDIKSDTQSD
jgi:hypothetical protein